VPLKWSWEGGDPQPDIVAQIRHHFINKVLSKATISRYWRIFPDWGVRYSSVAKNATKSELAGLEGGKL